MKLFNLDNIRELSLNITDAMVRDGYVNTDSEFDVQDIITRELCDKFGVSFETGNECLKCEFDMGDAYENCGGADDGVCPECGTEN